MSKNIAAMIDHTLLKPESTKDAIVNLCNEAMEYEFATVCIPPYWVPVAHRTLQGSKVGITTVIGFPHGVTSTFAKAAETRDAIASGATEIDMVINVGALKSGDEAAVLYDIAQVVEAAGEHAVKVILETSSLTDDEKRTACELAKNAGAAFVKTSTGFASGGAAVDDIKLMRAAVGPDIGVKASGGVRDLATAQAMIDAGATRIGASAGIAIVNESK